MAVDALKKQLADIELTRQRNVDKINAEHASAAEKASAIKLENAHADELAAQASATSATQQRVIALDTDRKTIEAQTQHDLTLLSINAEMLSTQASLATTRKERLALELQALENKRQTEKKTLEGQLKVLAIDDPRRRDVQTSLDALPAKYAGKAEQTRQGNLSPLDAYRKQLQGAVGDNAALRDSFEQVAVNGIGRVSDQLTPAAAKALGLKGAFGEMIASVIADLEKLALEKGILALLGLIGGGGFSGGSAISGPDSLVGYQSASDALSGLSLPGFASGGSATIGGRSGVDQNVLSINGQPALRVGKGEQLTVSPQNQVISPNNSAIAPSGSGGQITVHVEANDYFDARVAHISGPIAQNTSVRVVKAAAPTIVGQAVNAAPARVSQMQTLGS